jgi:hypothetical protein
LGIKSYALNFERRQAIRDTWLHADFLSRLCAYFIIGKPSRADALNALLKEKEIYRDILLGSPAEIPVEDSYHTLPEKIMTFISWIIRKFAGLKSEKVKKFPFRYLVVCDDDVYVNITHLHHYLDHYALSDRFYGGEV